MHGGRRYLCAFAAHSGSRWYEVKIYKEANVELSQDIRKYLQKIDFKILCGTKLIILTKDIFCQTATGRATLEIQVRCFQ